MSLEEATTLLSQHSETEDHGFVSKIRTNALYRWKLFRTFWLWWSFLVFGWIYGQIGPTLPDLQLLLDLDLQTASWLFSSFSFGYMIGCLIYGFIDGKTNATILLFLCCFGSAIFTTAVPWCPTLWLMLLMRVLLGICVGGLDSGTHAELFSIWRVQTATYVQVMYFSFGIGGLVSPIATKYFMATENDNFNLTMLRNGSKAGAIIGSSYKISASAVESQTIVVMNSERNSNASLFDDITNATVITDYAKPATHIQWAFLISGVLAMTASAGYLATYFKAKNHVEKEAIASAEAELRKRPSRQVFIIVMIVLTILLLLITGWIDSFAGYITTFCIRELEWSKESAVLAASVFWIAFCVANFFTIFLMQCFNTETLMFAYFILSMISFIGLLMSSIYKIVALAWVSVALVGVSMSIMWPAMFAWTEETVTEVTRRISSLYLIASGTGLMVNPILLGFLMDHVAEIWFVYLLMGEGFVIFVAFTFIAIIYRQLDPPVKCTEDVVVNQYPCS